MTTLSIVVPCFNEEACLAELHRRLTARRRAAAGDDYELVLINDGSSDGSMAGHAADRRKRRACARGQPVAQSRPPAGADRRPRPLPRRQDPDHRRRPAGSARAAVRECWRRCESQDADVVYGVRRSRAGETRVQARHRPRLLPPSFASDGDRNPARHGRLPADEPTRARGLSGDARAGALHPRHGAPGSASGRCHSPTTARKALRGGDQVSAAAR